MAGTEAVYGAVPPAAAVVAEEEEEEEVAAATRELLSRGIVVSSSRVRLGKLLYVQRRQDATRDPTVSRFSFDRDGPQCAR